MHVLLSLFFGFLLITSSLQACYRCCADEEKEEQKRERFILVEGMSDIGEEEEVVVWGSEENFTSYQNTSVAVRIKPKPFEPHSWWFWEF